MNVKEELYRTGIIPVVKLERAEDAVPLAKALRDGGLPAAEVTFRTGAAAQAIRHMTQELPEMLVGAGTVLSPAQADEAIAAGAKFIVSPGLNPKVVAHCQEKGIPMIPGVANPSDIEQALELGLDTVKFFPAEAAGGLPMLKAMAAPYGTLRFMPTGGLNMNNILPYLAYDRVLCCGGSFMVKDEWLKTGAFDTIRMQTRAAVLGMLGFSFWHVGLNTEDAAEAEKSARFLSGVFGLPMQETPKGYLGPGFEVMKGKGPGHRGHIGISTHSVDRAVAYLDRMGVATDKDTAAYDDKGRMKFIYLKEEFLGFGVHLVLG